ncbi:MAG: S-methyl-5'-thioadenosine phosphorylase [Bacillota bacterium]
MIAIIGGTGVYDARLLDDVRERVIKTPFGETRVKTGVYHGKECAFLARHGYAHTVPPHLVNYRANIWALASLDVEAVFATAAVGSLNLDMPPGCFVVVDQFIDMTSGRPSTFFEGGETGVVHTDFTEPYCPSLRALLARSLDELGIRYHEGGTYVCTNGPRFETPAEIRAYRILGADLVGMTNVPEVVLAREAGLCYGLVAMVTNYAAGISTEPLTHEEVLDVMNENQSALQRLLAECVKHFPSEKGCICRLSGVHFRNIWLCERK